MKKLSRKWARCSIACLVGGILMMGVTMVTNHPVWMIPGFVLVILAFVIRYKFLRCPGCGKGLPLPQWEESGTRYCHLCGIKLEYDN